MKQVIEIEVPDGKKAVWNNGKIEFIDVDIIELLKNSKDSARDLMDIIVNDIEKGDISLLNLYREYTDAPGGTYIELVAELKLFLAYLNKGHKFDLVSGKVYYPYVKFYLKSELPKGETVIGQFKYKGNIYVLVGDRTYHSSYVGLAAFDSLNCIGFPSFFHGFLACKDAKTAQFVATTFGKLLFDINYCDLIDYEWI